MVRRLHATEDEQPMRVVCRLIVPFDAMRTSPNRTLYKHWGNKTVRRAKRDLADAAFYSWHAAGRPRANGPVIVSYTIRRGRKMDQDNCAASMKWLSDSLFRGQIVSHDSDSYVTYNPPKQVTGNMWRDCPEIEVLVEEIG